MFWIFSVHFNYLLCNVKVSIEKFGLKFVKPAGTSRGVMTVRDIWLLRLKDDAGREGVGEIAPLPGLSTELDDFFEDSLFHLAQSKRPESILDSAQKISSLRMGWESAMLDMVQGGNQILFPSDFTLGVKNMRINGLIWMGSPPDMLEQIKQKLALGFSCLKLKIGAIEFEKELELLRMIRGGFSAADLELRVDANGAFSVQQVHEKLNRLSEFQIHSIEQPVAAGMDDVMAEICSLSPVPVALDESLIGVHDDEEKVKFLQKIKPTYIVLKPTLHGGFTGCDAWINAAEKIQCGYWITSALESNIGLNAIAQYAAAKTPAVPQGLGTGALFHSNFDCRLRLKGQWMSFDPQASCSAILHESA